MVDMDSDNPWETTGIEEQVNEENETGLDIISDILPTEDFKHFVKWTHAYKIGPDDPFYGNVMAVRVAFQSAAACGEAASKIQSNLEILPKTIQNAVILGAGDIKGEVKQAFDANIETLKTGIAGGIKAGAKINIDAMNLLTDKFSNAISEFDSKLDKAIILHKDQVLAEWVQSGSEELNRKIRAEVKRKQNFSLGFMLFLNWMSLIIGAIGMFLLIHLK